MQVRGGTDFNKGKRNELAILQVMDRAYCIIRRVIPVACPGLPNFIRCHSRFRISRIELVYPLPPHTYKCIGS